VSQLQRDGYSLHWEQTGTGSPVLLIMGAVYSSAMWYPALPALAAQHRLISFDNRGTGKSTWTPTASIADMTADALAVLDAADLERAHVYGISLGGVIALELALAAPERVRSLVLGATCVLTPDKPRAPLEVNDALLAASRRDLADIATLAMPALVMHGTEDPIVPVDWGRELADTLPDSRLRIYEDCGHNYLVEMGDVPNRDVLDFLAEVDAVQPVKAL
jgi:pimeloyl-ACP methyl ester carboxylesterase